MVNNPNAMQLVAMFICVLSIKFKPYEMLKDIACLRKFPHYTAKQHMHGQQSKCQLVCVLHSLRVFPNQC